MGVALPKTLERISETIWELPASYKEVMKVPARIYSTERLIREMDEAVYDQITNVATLPGITKYLLYMPDGHFGYGLPIGVAAAFHYHRDQVQDQWYRARIVQRLGCSPACA